MITIIAFIAAGLILWIIGFFYTIEFDTIILFSFLISVFISIPYYAHNILNRLNNIEEKIKEKQDK